ncbi:MAG: hypothetical protein E6G02_09990 [Actinobacteria bacterium]|nr:MAG: hypothetical protein E6G02_09990 [Actinomycetota bacterium]
MRRSPARGSREPQRTATHRRRRPRAPAQPPGRRARCGEPAARCSEFRSGRREPELPPGEF